MGSERRGVLDLTVMSRPLPAAAAPGRSAVCLYELLEVARTASQDDIKKAYRR